MDCGNLSFFDGCVSYDGALLPGVRLPKIEVEKKYYDELGMKAGEDNFVFLQKLCANGLRKFELNDKQEYLDRLKMELDVFHELGFVDYVLLNWDILKFCHESGIPTGAGRGSSAGSLVLYLIGVTKVDPLKYGLFFERFVNKARSKKIEKDGITYLDGGLLPDVDNDISYNRRSEVISYIESRHKGKTSKILTLNTLSGKLCVKECGKIVGKMTEEEVNRISDSIPKKFGKVADLSEAVKESEVFRDWTNENSLVYEIACKLEGLNKNTGVHPSGIAISYYEISDICPIQKTSEGEFVSGYDMNYVAELVVKFDILGLRTLTVADNVCKNVGINLDDIDPNDPVIYKSLQNLLTPKGIFQIEADTNYKVCKKINPKDLEQLSAVVAISRPGALAFVDKYASFCLTNQSEIVHSFFEKELSYTGGIPLYQEQLLQMLGSIGFTASEAEQVRKIVGKKLLSQMPAWQQKIKDKVQEKNLDPAIGEIVWKVAEDSANYSFNRCLLPETTVETIQGTKCLFEVEVGDYVSAYDVENDKDHFVEVLNIHKNKVPVYEVEMEDGTMIRCSMDHKFLCSDKKMHTLREIISQNLEIMCK